MIDVTLTKVEVEYCEMVAISQTDEAIRRGNKNRHGLPVDQGRDADIAVARIGVLGEFAFCKQFNFVFQAELEKSADVGRAIEIRTTHYPRGKLIWRPSTDKMDHAYVLVRCPNLPAVEIVGWTTGLGAKMQGKFEDPCRFLGRKAREKVFWVEAKDLCCDWEVLESFYYGKADEQKRRLPPA